MALGRLDRVRLGLSAIADLRDAINETTALAVWGGQGPVIVRWERPRRPITVNVITGATLNLLASAAGRVFAAWLPPAQIEPLVQAELDSGKCRANVQTLDEARAVLARCARGLAAISGHYMVRGVEAMAAPVFNFKQDITLGLVVVGVEGSLDMREDSPTVTALREAAHALSLRLGYAPPAAERLAPICATAARAVFCAVIRCAPQKKIHKNFLVGKFTYRFCFDGTAHTKQKSMKILPSIPVLSV